MTFFSSQSNMVHNPMFKTIRPAWRTFVNSFNTVLNMSSDMIERQKMRIMQPTYTAPTHKTMYPIFTTSQTIFYHPKDIPPYKTPN